MSLRDSRICVLARVLLPRRMALDVGVFNAARVLRSSIGCVFSSRWLVASAGWAFAVDPEVVAEMSLRLRAVCFVRDMEYQTFNMKL